MERFETLTKYPHERRHPLCENTTLSSEEQRAETRLAALRAQEMISRVNEAFQECLTTSWYGELNETYHLKRSAAQPWPGAAPEMKVYSLLEKCFPMAKVRSLIQVHVQRGQGQFTGVDL